MFADLHLHTIFSDGTYTPEELAGRARQLGLAAVAVTDHDTVEACDRMSVACQPAGLEFISAFLRATTEGTPPPVTGEDHLKVLKVVEAAYESSATGRRIDL